MKKLVNGKEWKREDGIEIAEEIHTIEILFSTVFELNETFID